MKQGKAKSCPFLQKEEKGKLDFQAHLMADIKDIEDTAELGKRIGSCSYYGTRGSLESAEIITLPYNLMLMKSAREALGIDIKNNIVIFDEAHNSMSNEF